MYQFQNIITALSDWHVNLFWLHLSAELKASAFRELRNISKPFLKRSSADYDILTVETEADKPLKFYFRFSHGVLRQVMSLVMGRKQKYAKRL